MSETKFCVIRSQTGNLKIVNQSAIEYIEIKEPHEFGFNIVTSTLKALNYEFIQKDLDFQNAIDCLKREQLKNNFKNHNEDNYAWFD